MLLISSAVLLPYLAMAFSNKIMFFYFQSNIFNNSIGLLSLNVEFHKVYLLCGLSYKFKNEPVRSFKDVLPFFTIPWL